MDKDKAIEQINLTKQRVNEGSKTFRDQIDYNVLPLVKESPVVTSLVKEARTTWTAADRAAKDLLEEAKMRILVPTVKHKLDPKKVYQIDVNKPEVKALSPCLIPSLGFQQKLTDENTEKFADRWAQEGWGSIMRLFAAGNFEPGLKLSQPYLKEVGRFNLMHKNLLHFDSLWRRAGYFVERDIYPMFTLLDGCSLHEGRPGFWNTHWMNGKNNVNGTHTSWHSQTHWMDDKHQGEAGFVETKKYLLELYEYVFLEAKKHFGKFFLIEIGNEIDARTDYHSFMRLFCNQTLNQGNLDRRVFTSMLNENRFFYSRPDSNVQNYCIRVLHNVRDYTDYLNRKYIFGSGTHMVSQDGQMPIVTAATTKSNVKAILQSESKGYEGNLRPLLELKNGMWVNVGYDADWSLESLEYQLFRAYGDAFSEVVG